jgi:uncharacterized membrane protein YraQ (UPF0718 family)
MSKIKTTKRDIRSNKNKSASGVVWNFPLDKTDLKWLIIGIGVVALGFLLLATGITEEPAVESGKWNNFIAVNVAPIVLLICYCVIIPLALFKFFSKRKIAKTTENTSENEK